ncbi:MAG: hypothetical protein B7733_00710 [Myxococcales bacterium FL481]|nr:MAG: hypothetical protein B7733_00710 [Myxococcales bacterium FL481]
MPELILNNTSLIDASGYVVIAAILVLFVTAVVFTLAARGRYAVLERDLRRHAQSGPRFNDELLNRIVDDVRHATTRSGAQVNTQAIIEHHFTRHLPRLLLAERFVRASTGLLIVLGLVGTFYGLTLSIGKLVVLLSTDATEVGALTQSLTKGLLQALSGMSVAFSTSLLGVTAAVLMTLFNVFASIAERRNALTAALETYLESNVLAGGTSPSGADSAAGLPDGTGLAPMVAAFGASVERLDGAISRFDQALDHFATNTRDFQEFNLHLKDNISRLSLCFADFTATLAPPPHSQPRPPQRR